jgi:hypothetical protein
MPYGASMVRFWADLGEDRPTPVSPIASVRVEVSPLPPGAPGAPLGPPRPGSALDGLAPALAYRAPGGRSSHAPPAGPEGRPSFAVGVLVHRGSAAFRAAMESWRASGLLGMASQVLVFVQEVADADDPVGDPRIAGLPRPLDDYGRASVLHAGEGVQAGISGAMLAIAEAVDPSVDALLFLEEDWRVAEDVREGVDDDVARGDAGDVDEGACGAPDGRRGTRDGRREDVRAGKGAGRVGRAPGGDPPRPAPTLARRVLDALTLLRDGFADVVRLRSRRFPGRPHCDGGWRGREREILGVFSPDVANHTVLSTAYWLPDPPSVFPDQVWRCRGGGGAPPAPRSEASEAVFCAKAPFAGWSNNPFLALRGWWLGNVGPVAAADAAIFDGWPVREGRRGDKGRLEAAINLSPHLWDDRGHVVAHGEGLFTHADVDRPMHVQSPCTMMETLPLSDV